MNHRVSRLNSPMVSFAFSAMNSAVSALFVISKSPGFRVGACTTASLARWVVQPAQQTVSYFIPSATTGFIAYVFLYPNRVSFREAFEVLEPEDGKLSRPVLRGPGLRNGVRLLDRNAVQRRICAVFWKRMSLKMQISYHRFDWAPVPGKKRFPGIGLHRANRPHTPCRGNPVSLGIETVLWTRIRGHHAW